MAALGSKALLVGLPTLIGRTVNELVDVNTYWMSIVAACGADRKIRMQAVATSYDACSGNVEFSLDGGTTWSVLQAFDFKAATGMSFTAEVGVLYRLNVGTVTNPVAINLYAVLG